MVKRLMPFSVAPRWNYLEYTEYTMARLRIKTKRTRLTISTRHAIRVGPFHGSYTERHSCHEHTSEARLGCRAVLRRRLSVRYDHGCNPCLPAPARREPCRYRLVGPGWAPMDAQVPLGARRGRLGPPTHVGLDLPSADVSAARRPCRLARPGRHLDPLERPDSVRHPVGDPGYCDRRVHDRVAREARDGRRQRRAGDCLSHRPDRSRRARGGGGRARGLGHGVHRRGRADGPPFHDLFAGSAGGCHDFRGATASTSLSVRGHPRSAGAVFRTAWLSGRGGLRLDLQAGRYGHRPHDQALLGGPAVHAGPDRISAGHVWCCGNDRGRVDRGKPDQPVGELPGALGARHFPGGVQPGVCRGCGAAAEYGADVRRLDGGVVLRGTGHGPLSGVSHEHLLEGPRGHTVCSLERVVRSDSRPLWGIFRSGDRGDGLRRLLYRDVLPRVASVPLAAVGEGLGRGWTGEPDTLTLPS